MRIAHELKEARENLAYWKRRQAHCTDHDAKIQAAVRIAAWSSTVAAKESALDALNAPTPA